MARGELRKAFREGDGGGFLRAVTAKLSKGRNSPVSGPSISSLQTSRSQSRHSQRKPQAHSENSAVATQPSSVSDSAVLTQNLAQTQSPFTHSIAESEHAPISTNTDQADQIPGAEPNQPSAINTNLSDPELEVDGGAVLSPTITRVNEQGRLEETEHIHLGRPQGRDRSESFTPSIFRTSTSPILAPGNEVPTLTPPSSRLPPPAPLLPVDMPINVQNGARPQDEAITMTLTSPLSRPRGPKSPSYLDNEKQLDYIFPRTINCTLTVTFNEQQSFDEALTVEEFQWYREKRYKKLKDKIKKMRDVLKDNGVTKDTDKMYLRYASCFVKGDRNQSNQNSDDNNMLIDDEDSIADAAIQAVCGFIHQFPFQPFKLEIHCDYSSIEKALIDTDAVDNSGFSQTMRDIYMDKLSIGRPNVRNQRYISRADQNNLTRRRIVQQIVEEDAHSSPKNKLSPDQKKDLTQEIMRRTATTLQAICVYDCIPMSFLYHFLLESPHHADRHSDSIETLRLTAPTECHSELCARYYARFMKNTYVFYPDTVKSDAEHSKKPEKVIVPVRYVHVGVTLGEGAFSTVHEVDIDPHYQWLTPDVTKTYALKIFNAIPRIKAGFDREIAMLLHLARYLPHEHILTHVTSWEQGGTCYILYEKAHCNLRKHMEKHPGGNLSRKHVLWFFHQLRGLADAVRRVHFFHESQIDAASGEVKLKKTGMIGRHHDIKPENILAFDFPENLPTLKLSDFGSGKFSAVRAFSEVSQGASAIRGTQTYVGPESQRGMNEEMSRPFDIWALGCVFLELLLWFLAIEKPDGVQTFADMRTAERFNPRPEEYDYFWQRNSMGFMELNRAVQWILDDLQHNVCQGKDKALFWELVAVIRNLLKIRPADRPDAVNVFNKLDFILVKAKAEYDCEEAGDTFTKFTNGRAAVDQLEDDVSTTGKSRVRSVKNFHQDDDEAFASDPPITGETKSSLTKVGIQFQEHPSLESLQMTQSSDEDAMPMSGSSRHSEITSMLKETERTMTG